jgi:hypothetical protein
MAGSVFAGVALILWLTNGYGVGATPDSVKYVATARSLASGNGFVDYDGSAITIWPPLYPSLLALAQVGLNSDPLQSARFINALLFGLIIYLSIKMTASICPTDGKAIALVAILVLLASPLQQVSVMAWSEPLFIALALLFLLSLGSFLKDRTLSRFALMGIIAAVAPLVRYMGLTLIMTGVISMLLMPRWKWIERWKFILPFGLLTPLPLLAWLVRNHGVSGTLLGPRSPATFLVAQIVEQTLGLLFVWLLPWFLVLLLLLLLTIYNRVGKKGYLRRVRSSWHQLAPLLVFTIIYISMLLYSESVTELNEVDNRYMSPVFVPLILLALFLVLVSWDQLGRHLSGRSTNLLVFGSSVLLTGYSLLITGLVDITYLRSGAGGFGTKLWHESELIQYIRSNPELQKRGFYSNSPDVSYLLLDLKTKWVPSRPQADSTDSDGHSPPLHNGWPPEDGFLVWYDNIERDYLLTVEEMRLISRIERVVSLSDGSVYRIHGVE